MRYFSSSSGSIKKMLEIIGKENISDLFASIPASDVFKSLELPEASDEHSIKNALKIFSTDDAPLCFLGGGACAHFIPEWVNQQLLRSEWYTPYTPYQPEVSQGTLQAIFEFQSVISDLFGLDVANASLYDGATALVEALLMATRLTQKNEVILAESIHPEYRAAAETYLKPAGIVIHTIDFDDSGTTDLKKHSKNYKNIAAIAAFSPNFFGRLEDLFKLKDMASQIGALLIAGTTDITSCAIIRSFGELGADIAVGEGLGLCGPLQMGGPGVGLFACRNTFLRQMPGRIVGKTIDKNGAPCFVLTLSTREQHIRREKATSNVCTNHNLMAISLLMTLCAYGRSGFLKLATTNLQKTLYFRKCLKKSNLKIAFVGPHYNETVIDLESDERVHMVLEKARKENFLGGVSLSKFYPSLTGHLMVCTTEMHSDEQIDRLARIIAS